MLVLLDHGPEFDAALIAGLRGRGFIGALGSRHTQAARRERMLAAGVTEDELARLYGPVGLDLGARTAAETAVSIVAQVIAVRGGSVLGLGRSAARRGRRAASADDRDRPHTAAPPRVVLGRTVVLGAVVVALFVVGGTAFRVWQVARAGRPAERRRRGRARRCAVRRQPSSIFAARLRHAAALYDDKLAPRIVTTGGGRPGDAYTEAEAGRRYLIKLGVLLLAVVAVPAAPTPSATCRPSLPARRRTGGTGR